MDFSWAEPYPEIHKICNLFQLSEVSNPVKFSYKSLKVLQQIGPQCGLVALAMCLGRSDRETVDELYKTAKDKGYTYNGEMFSVQDMFQLASYFSPKNTYVKIYEGDMNCKEVQDFLLKGGMVLVPYDTNKDNSPGLLNGHKAHWAVICGAIKTTDDFYVIARHGKAKNVNIWKLSHIAKSNKQLLDFAPDQVHQEIEYKLPEGGISGPDGLNQKCLLINLEKQV
ncbi:unnamed protein product [Acanthoscelides obtectus]|uniref:Actin maturation protease n=1 Tax=Acanthoscelides obtectus TaxID=200917 RepID=A0A9P0KTW0_ACAOB|nr:unnamed protein product [Acanthoscelides obtectus]CAK1677388.1 UPF0692 protein CG33108 [Acanthoscelides obtectus]